MEIDSEDASLRASAAITAQLESWVSPRVGGLPPRELWNTYEEDAVQWMETTIGGGEDRANEDDTEMTERGLSRVLTPVRNNSSNRELIKSPLDFSVPLFKPIQTQSDYKLYHDALWSFRRGRHEINEQMEIDGANNSISKLETELDLNYLVALSQNNNLWSLLTTLRTIGIDALWMTNQPFSAVSDCLTRLAKHTHCTPAQLINMLYTQDSPLIIRRRRAIIEWMEDCNAQDEVKLPRHKRHPSSRQQPNSTILPETPTEEDLDLIKASLTYIISGQMERAVDLCKTHGQAWRSAVWGGGEPFDLVSVPNDETQTVVTVKVGNPARPLWKLQCRKMARSPVIKDTAEGAIHALLSDDLETAVTNPYLRSRQKAMYACFSSLQGRLEDELLHRYYVQIRREGRAYPGSNYEREELEHLQATSPIAGLTEMSILQKLKASAFTEIRVTSPIQSIIAAFVQSGDAVQVIIQSLVPQVSKDKDLLRVMTHLLLYLDFLREGSYPIRFDGLDTIRHAIVLQYLRHLATKPDLWKHMTIYASLLPINTMIGVFPGLLTSVQVPEERQIIWNQMRELLNEEIHLVVLKKVVRSILANQDLSDAQKFHSISWLCFVPEHLGEALVCWNSLLRQLLLQNKTSVATQLMKEDMSTIFFDPEVGDTQAKRELGAISLFLDANIAFDDWKNLMVKTSPESMIQKYNSSNLTVEEQMIARSSEKRQLYETMRGKAQKVIEFADTAHSKLLEVLCFAGGWLTEDEDDEEHTSSEERKRRSEMDQLHAKLIPEIAFLFHNVCSETAKWMDDMLEDAKIILNAKSKAYILREIDSNEDISPIYWLRQAMDLAEIISSEENELYKSFNAHHLRLLMEQMTDIEIRTLEWQEGEFENNAQ